MQSKRDELIPVGEVVSGLGGPVAAIRDASPQAIHHFTLRRSGKPACLGQRSGTRSRLHGAAADAVQRCPAPTPATSHQYKRVNGPYTLIMTATGNYKLPYGTAAAPVDGLAIDRSGTDPKPRD